MLMNLDYFFKQFGAEDWEVLRGGVAVGTVHGLRRKERQKIDFKPGTDVREGDVLTGKVCGQTYTISKTDTVTVLGKVYSLEAIYGGEKSLSKGHTVNIGKMVGSAFAMDSPGAVQTINFSSGQVADLKVIVRGLLGAIDELGLNDDDKKDVKEDADHLRSKLESGKAQPGLVREILSSLREKLIEAGTAAAASGVVTKAQHYAGLIGDFLNEAVG
jgi:hypothetical protein